MFPLPELIVEQATLDWFTELGYTTLNASQIAPYEPNAERQTYSDVILTQRLENARQTINPNIPPSAIEDAIKKLTRIESPNLYENNRRFHKLLTDGVDVNYHKDDRTIYDKVWLIDFHNPDNKKIAGYHQYHAINKAVVATIEATQSDGDRKVGVVWHTQGSYAGKIIQQPEMANPTLVILTDRNDLDDQLFNTFSLCSDLLRQTPTQAEDRENLQKLLQVASGGIVFTTIQKFAPHEGIEYPQLSDRQNIVLIADEAHRSQYGLKAKLTLKSDKNNIYSFPPQKTTLKVAETSKNPYKITPIDKEQEITAARITYGYAKYLRDAIPNASFIGFTGTPIEATDINTPAVFGNYLDIYDIQRAVEDEATVRIYYEGRLAKLELEVSEKPNIDPEFAEITEYEEEFTKEKLKSKWARHDLEG
jgi:type I site-specific restriction-modification system R (restriction) subunit